MSTTAPARTRPRDRKQRIEDAAARAFAERGYHQVSMNDIAAIVGISAPALYRHFPNKYALFVNAAFRTAHRLNEDADALALEPSTTPDEAIGALDRLLDAAIATTIELRDVGGIYRWEGRYLEAEDRARLTAEFDTLRARFADHVAVCRPELVGEQRGLVVWAALSAVASITAHRGVVAARSLRALLRAAAWRALDADVPAGSLPSLPRDVADEAAERRRERIIAEAIRLFAAQGYHDVSIEEIAAAVDLTPSGVYRHFEGKSAILLEACERAADRLSEGWESAKAAAVEATPDEAVRLLARDYVRHTVDNHRLMRVYFADVGSLDPDARRRLRALQRTYVDEWVDLLLLARPDLTAREAAVLVHAGFSVVADLGTLARVQHLDLSEPTAALMIAVLGV